MSAIISKCGTYRYRLERQELVVDRTIAYFGVNPSTADAEVDDATIRKLKTFTQLLGYQRLLVGNVFAFRATDVKQLASAINPIGPDNHLYLRRIVADADLLVPCWGSITKVPKRLRDRFYFVMQMLVDSGKPVRAFGLTKRGDPLHPLFLPYTTRLIDISPVLP